MSRQDSDWMKKRFLCILVLLCLCTYPISAQETVGGDDVTKYVQILKDRASKIVSAEIEFNVKKVVEFEGESTPNSQEAFEFAVTTKWEGDRYYEETRADGESNTKIITSENFLSWERSSSGKSQLVIDAPKQGDPNDMRGISTFDPFHDIEKNPMQPPPEIASVNGPDGRALIELRIVSGSLLSIWKLDPSQGYLPTYFHRTVKTTSTSDGGATPLNEAVIETTYEVLESKEVSPGLFIPVSALTTVTNSDKSSVNRVRVEYVASSFSVNADIPDSIFTIEKTRGMQVTDLISNVQYMVGHDEVVSGSAIEAETATPILTNADMSSNHASVVAQARAFANTSATVTDKPTFISKQSYGGIAALSAILALVFLSIFATLILRRRRSA